MGKKSRAKRDRTPVPPQYHWNSVFFDGSNWLFVIGIFVLSYGTAAMQYSRWDHAENAHVHPVFHPWAIVVGLILLVISLKKK